MKKNWPSKFRNLVGDQIRKARLRCRPPVSQDDLSGRLAAIGVVLDRSAISRIESRTRIVTDYEVDAIARCLKVGVETFFRGTLESVRKPSR